MGSIAKRLADTELSDLSVPEMTHDDWAHFNEGIELFNSDRFWDAHEAWEDIWKQHRENSRIFFQGLIQVAAALHQLQREIYHGVDKHLQNALWKLKPFQPEFLGIDVDDLITGINLLHACVIDLGEQRLRDVPKKLIPVIKRADR
jgi:predicted metal-dependent hydrolase